jgi:plastocyanin
MKSLRAASGFAVLVAGFALSAASIVVGPAAGAQEQRPTERPTRMTASKYRFDPPRIEVTQDDLVRIELKTADIAHSFTIDDYRIAKRVNPGRPIAFEFRADKAGTFPFYCNLQIDDGCRQMRGELVVQPRR